MTIQKYSLKEALNRIIRSLIGESVSQDTPNTVTGEIYSEDEAASLIAELLQGSYPGKVLNLPSFYATSLYSYGAITADADIRSGDDIIAADAIIASGTVWGLDVRATNTVYTDSILADAGGALGDLAAGNYTGFDSDGTQILYGNATVWEDLRFPALALRVPASGAAAEPDLVQFRDNDDGSTGVFSFAFDPGTEEEMYFAAQMPHEWAGTPIEPHVHWSVMTNCTGTVSWGLEYTWSEITGTFGFTNLIYGNVSTPNEANKVAYRHYLTDLPAITGSFGSGTLSSMLIGRIFRDATGAGLGDSCPQDAILLEVDFHYEIDRLGSNQEYVR